jgi:Transcriptional regulator
MAKRVTPRTMQALETKRNLLDAAKRLMDEKGYEATTIHDICSDAGVSIGAFYHHLKNKEGIIVELYLECDRYFENTILPRLKASSMNGIDRIIAYIGEQAQYAEDTGVRYIIPIYKAQITAGNDFFLSLQRGLPNGLLQLIVDAQKRGELRSDRNAESICEELLLVSRGVIYHWCQSGGNYRVCRYAKDIVGHHLQFFSAES